MNSRFSPLCDESASSWLKPGGKFEQSWERFEARAGQVQMAEAVERALASETVLFCEAGTGTGKTLAYLLAAIQSGRRVVVSTATRALQDQIWDQDLPLIERVLGRPISAVVMKGLSNYLCLRRAQNAAFDPELTHRKSLGVIQRWQQETEFGELSEIEELTEGDPALALVHSSSDTRIGARCAFHDRCFVTHMKRRAEAAQLLIVNHHLFFADLALRGPHPGRVIPDYDAVILDEAHQVEDIAGLFFGVRVSQRRLRGLAKDAAMTFAKGSTRTNLTAQLERAEQALFDCLARAGATGHRIRLDRDSWNGATYQAYLDLDGALEGLGKAAEVGLRDPDDDATTTEGLESVIRRTQELRDALSFIVDDHYKHVTWLDVSSQGHSVSSSPVDLAPVLSERLFRRVPSVILTSATMAAPPTESSVAADHDPYGDAEGAVHAVSRFGFYRTRLGATGSDLEVREVVVDSPFDFRRNALLYLAKDLPEPREQGFEQSALATVMALLLAADGGAFILTTSLRAMRELHEGLSRGWQEQPWRNAPPPLLLQGHAPKTTLLARFRASGRAVLVATMGFWEGVDVPGDALRLVLIDKIPFAVPTDPLVQARVQHLEQSGRNPFTELFIPSAQMALKQGFGRLIRSQSDRGVVALLDSRVCRKGYGQRILSALPPARRTTRLIDAVTFLKRD